jgi:membrane protease YdiL (CAAX protease family)
MTQPQPPAEAIRASHFMHMRPTVENRRLDDRCALLFALVFPTLLTWIYFVALARFPAAVQQGAYAVGKTLQFAFPVIWVFVVRREEFCWAWPRRRGLIEGLAFGSLVLLAMLILYYGWLGPRGYFDLPAVAIREKVAGMGLDSKWKYASLGVFYAVCHSFMEEYYWRWFVFARLRRHTSLAIAVGVSSAGFMAHHVILLATFFGWTSPATYLFSLAVAVGGAAWAWIYQRSQSLFGPWISHLLVDAGIFIIGYDLARDLLL